MSLSTSTTSTPAAPRRGAGVSSLVASGLLFGAAAPLGGLLGRVAGLSPVAIAAYRLAVGGLLVAGLLICLSRVPRGRAAWARICAVAVLAAVCQVCYFASAAVSSVTTAVLVTIGTTPVLVLAVEWLTGRRAGSRRTRCAVPLALGGLGLLVGMPSGGQGPGAALAGVGLALVAAMSFAAITLAAARPVSGVDELATVGFGFGCGGLLLVPVAMTGAGLAFRPEVPALGLLALLCTVPTGLAYVLYLRGVRLAGAGTGAVLALLEPLCGAVLAAVLFGDRLGPVGLSGAALLASAMIVAARR